MYDTFAIIMRVGVNNRITTRRLRKTGLGTVHKQTFYLDLTCLGLGQWASATHDLLFEQFLLGPMANLDTKVIRGGSRCL
jgi:hypothetical protein